MLIKSNILIFLWENEVGIIPYKIMSHAQKFAKLLEFDLFYSLVEIDVEKSGEKNELISVEQKV